MISRSRLLIPALCLLGCNYLAECHADARSQIEHGNVFFDVSPDGEQIAFSSADGDLYLFDLSARTVSQLTETVAVESAPAYSPDGKSLVYVSTEKDRRGNCIFRFLVDGTGAEQLTSDEDVSDWGPAYSRDGSQIAFARAHKYRPYSLGGWVWDDWDVYAMDADGGNVKRLTHNNYYGSGSSVTFSPDGKKLLFCADSSDLNFNVFEVAVDGSAPPKTGVPQPTSAGDYAAWASDPAYSADGQQVAVISDRDTKFGYDILLIDLASGNPRALRVTTVSDYNKQPVFAPDSKQIYFLAGTEENAGSRAIFSLWSIGADGKNAHEVADSQLFTNPRAWRDSTEDAP
jgi:TolB protein